MNSRPIVQPDLQYQKPTAGDDLARKERFIYPIQQVLFCLLLIGLVATNPNDPKKWFPALLLGAAVLALTRLLTHRGRFREASILLMAALIGVEDLLLVFGNGIHDIIIVIFPVMLVLASLQLERNAYIAISTLSVLSIVGVGSGELAGIVVTRLSRETHLADLFILASIVALTAWVVRLLADHLLQSLREAQRLAKRQSALIDEVRRRAEHLSILNQVGAAVASGLDLEHVLSSLHNRIQVVAPNETFYVALYDRETEEITFPFFVDLDEHIVVHSQEARDQPGLTGEVIHRRRTIYLPDMHDPGDYPDLPVVTLGDSTTRSYVGVPLFLKDEVIGVMSVQSESPHAYHPDQIRLLETIANHAAIAIQNARLYTVLQADLDERLRMETALRQRDSILEAVTLAAGAFLVQAGWRDSVQVILGRLGQETGSTHACLYQTVACEDEQVRSILVDEWTAEGAVPYLAPETTAELFTPLPLWQEWLNTIRSGQAFQQQKRQANPVQAAWFTQYDLRAFLDIPILIDGWFWGHLGFYDAVHERAWSQTEIDAIHIAAGLLSAAIQRQQDDQHIRQLNAELENRVRERTTDLESFAYSVAHDLRAPLRGIDGYSKLLLEEYGDRIGSEGRAYLDNVRRAAQWMGQIIEDLLRLSRITRIELRSLPVDLSQISAEILAGLQAQSPDRSVDWSVQSGLFALGDPNLLRLAIDNLLNNAWKFTSKTGAAQIEVGQKDRSDQRVFFVRDNGVGFDMRYSNKLFGPFQRLHTAGEFEGTGIGLATVKRIIQRHGGEIWAESEPGKGATFLFTLAA